MLPTTRRERERERERKCERERNQTDTVLQYFIGAQDESVKNG